MVPKLTLAQRVCITSGACRGANDEWRSRFNRWSSSVRHFHWNRSSRSARSGTEKGNLTNGENIIKWGQHSTHLYSRRKEEEEEHKSAKKKKRCRNQAPPPKGSNQNLRTAPETALTSSLSALAWAERGYVTPALHSEALKRWICENISASPPPAACANQLIRGDNWGDMKVFDIPRCSRKPCWVSEWMWVSVSECVSITLAHCTFIWRLRLRLWGPGQCPSITLVEWLGKDSKTRFHHSVKPEQKKGRRSERRWKCIHRTGSWCITSKWGLNERKIPATISGGKTSSVGNRVSLQIPVRFGTNWRREATTCAASLPSCVCWSLLE